MNKKRQAIIAGNKISNIYTFSLGGFNQKVLIEGKTSDLPILITLHGGPGTPIPFSVGSRGMFPEFTDKFIMVYWDQLGCGINNHMIDDSFTIDSFVQMTKELITNVKELFPDNKLFLFSTSWGSILSAKLLEQLDLTIDGVVVWGQILKNVFYNQEVFHELEASKLSPNKVNTIKNTDIHNVTSKDLRLISTSLQRYTNGYQNKTVKQAGLTKIIGGLLTSPDYKFKDFKAMVFNGYLNNVSLWKEILTIDLSETLKHVQIPYAILQGDTDIVASTSLIKEFVDHCGNKDLTYTIIPNSGHIPGASAMDAVLQHLLSLSN